jgi:hypothetical protein
LTLDTTLRNLTECEDDEIMLYLEKISKDKEKLASVDG